MAEELALGRFSSVEIEARAALGIATIFGLQALTSDAAVF